MLRVTVGVLIKYILILIVFLFSVFFMYIAMYNIEAIIYPRKCVSRDAITVYITVQYYPS